jgi:hypothetical protein
MDLPTWAGWAWWAAELALTLAGLAAAWCRPGEGE